MVIHEVCDLYHNLYVCEESLCMVEKVMVTHEVIVCVEMAMVDHRLQL